MAETLTIRTASSTEVVKIAVPGPQGPAGQGVPVGGSTGQVLRKASGTNYDTEWAAAGSGSGSVTSVALASSDFTISGSPITDAGTITANLGNTGVTAGTYTKVTVDAKGRVTTGETATATDVGAPPTSRTISAGTGLSGGGDLTANRTLSVSFGSSAGTACEGNDARLSDARTPSSTLAHKNSHSVGQSDALLPSDIGAQSLFTAVNVTSGMQTSPHQLSALQAQAVRVAINTNFTIRLPETGHQSGDIVEIRAATLSSGATITIERGVGPSFWTTIATINSQGCKLRFVANGTGRSNWEEDTYFTTNGTLGAPANHTHTPSEVGLGNVSNTAQITSVSGTAPIVSSGGTTPVISVTVGTTSGSVAAGDDSRIVGAAQKSANLSDLASASTARTNLGLGTAATAATGDFAAASHNHAASAITSGIIDTARLGSGTANNTTYLRGDQTWATVSGGASINQSIAVGFVLN